MERARDDGWRRFEEAWRRPLGAGEIVLELIALAGVGVNAGLAAYYGPRLAGRIPVHFDLAGRPDRFGGPGALWEGVVVSLLLYGLLTVVPRLPARWLNVPVHITPENAARVAGTMRSGLRVLKMLLVWLFTYILWRSIAVAQGAVMGLGPWFVAGIILGSNLLLVVFCWFTRRAGSVAGK